VRQSRREGVLPKTQRTKEIDAMQLINGTGGLCATCNNAETCFYRATRGPALLCELFDNFVAPAEGRGHQVRGAVREL
jgi:hypothetical protein